MPNLNPTPFWLIVHIGGNVERRLSRPTQTALRDAVRGYALGLSYTLAGEPVLAYVNDDTETIGQGVRVNWFGTRLLGVEGAALIGPVVLIGPVDQDGDEQPLTAAQVALVDRELAAMADAPPFEIVGTVSAV